MPGQGHTTLVCTETLFGHHGLATSVLEMICTVTGKSLAHFFSIFFLFRAPLGLFSNGGAHSLLNIPPLDYRLSGLQNCALAKIFKDTPRCQKWGE